MVGLETFRYGQLEVDYLTEADSRLGEAIARIGMIERRVTPDLFSGLVRSIVAQQISAKAADTVWRRMVTLLGEPRPEADLPQADVPPITPRRVAETSIEAIQACGLSMRKAGYIMAAAEAALSGRLDFDALLAKPDDGIIAQLSSLPGIGIWTAEMLLIFSLQRPDVVSWGDLAIRRGMMALYGLGELPRAEFETHRRAYSPYGSVASLYLWVLSVE